MNCFSHAFRFLDRDPYFIVGTCLPDWLSMIARKTRAREKNALKFVAGQGTGSEGSRSDIAAGIVRHHRDDHWFHGLREFVQLNLELALELRELLGKDAGFRPHLVGHILIEVLLDGYLHERNPGRLDEYYDCVRQVDPVVVQQTVNEIAVVPTDKLAEFVPLFVREAYLYDYVDDQRVRYRLNRVLKRVKLAELPESFLDWLPSARNRVYQLAPAMLTPPIG